MLSYQPRIIIIIIIVIIIIPTLVYYYYYYAMIIAMLTTSAEVDRQRHGHADHGAAHIVYSVHTCMCTLSLSLYISIYFV